jgi:hypothetical protein
MTVAPVSGRAVSSPLSKKLRSLRARAVKSGMKLLSADEVLETVRQRRNGSEKVNYEKVN